MFGPASRLTMADKLPTIVKPASDLAITYYTVAAIRRDGVWRSATMTWIPPEEP